MIITDYIKLPISSDGMCYLWDANSDMVADVHVDHSRPLLDACAAAINHAHGKLPQADALAVIYASGIRQPVRLAGDHGLDLVDAAGVTILRIRGWGRLQHLGHEAGVRAQETIARAFADALNALKP